MNQGPRRSGSGSSSKRGGLFGFGGSTDDADDFGGRSSFGRGTSGGSRGSDTPVTTERSTTKSFLGSLWSSWLGGRRSSPRSRSRSDNDEDIGSGSSGDNGRDSSSFGRDTSASGRSGFSDNDSGFSGSSGSADCPSSIDAFTPGPEGVSYMFQGSKVYELQGKSVKRTHSLRSLFPNGPIYVEAALVNPRQRTIALFQSYNVYVFKYEGSMHRFQLLPGHPKRVNSFNPVGAMVWSDGHQFLFSRNGEFAVYDDYWNEVQAVNRLGDYFPGFPAAAKGGISEGNILTAFTTARVYLYDINRRNTVGSSQSISAYLGC